MSAVPVDRGPPPNPGQEPPGQPSRGRNRRGRGRGQAPPRPEASSEATNVASGPPNGGAPNRRRNRGGQRQGRPTPSGGDPEHQLPPHLAANTPDDGASVAESTGSNTRRRRGRGGRGQTNSTGRPQPARGGRRENFGARLTDGGGQAGSTADEPIPTPSPPPTTGDLTSRLIYSLTHKEDAVDCPICFNPVHPTQPIWSCAPPPVDPLEDPSAAPVTCCWTIFHMRQSLRLVRRTVLETSTYLATGVVPAAKPNARLFRRRICASVLAFLILLQAGWRHPIAVASLVHGRGRSATTPVLWCVTLDPAPLVW
ncbi:hypothetical protein FRC07_010642 [Ceratobasidium sp. 392]|nr:hypothetical protein FRC07_010642 [Ceratobasidium sp. 392]